MKLRPIPSRTITMMLAARTASPTSAETRLAASRMITREVGEQQQQARDGERAPRPHGLVCAHLIPQSPRLGGGQTLHGRPGLLHQGNGKERHARHTRVIETYGAQGSSHAAESQESRKRANAGGFSYPGLLFHHIFAILRCRRRHTAD